MSEPVAAASAAASRADVAVAAAWFAFGAAVAVASWRMDRLADRGIEPWSAPGLTPGVVGVLVMAIALAVGLRARSERSAGVAAADRPSTARRTLAAGALCLAFAASLGHGLPFIASAVVFVFAFTAVFSWADWRAEARVGRGAATALAVAVAAGTGIALLFERVFLVRLP